MSSWLPYNYRSLLIIPLYYYDKPKLSTMIAKFTVEQSVIYENEASDKE